jgi:hypothetical protein
MKKTILILLILIIGLFLFGCTQNQKSESKNVLDEIELNCGTETGLDKNACIFSLAIETQSLEMCDEIGAKGDKVVCNAILTKNYSLCKSMQDSEITLKNTLMVRSCYYSIALETLNPKVCEQIDANEIKERCIIYTNAYKEKDPDKCKDFTKRVDTEFCYADYAIKYKDPTICENISDEDTKYLCIEWQNK